MLFWLYFLVLSEHFKTQSWVSDSILDKNISFKFKLAHTYLANYWLLSDMGWKSDDLSLIIYHNCLSSLGCYSYKIRSSLNYLSWPQSRLTKLKVPYVSNLLLQVVQVILTFFPDFIYRDCLTKKYWPYCVLTLCLFCNGFELAVRPCLLSVHWHESFSYFDPWQLGNLVQIHIGEGEMETSLMSTLQGFYFLQILFWKCNCPKGWTS